jgi:hypothetical protein
MRKTDETNKAASISDAAVQAKTGRTWQEWFAILDAAGAQKMNHKTLAAYLYEQLGCLGWWNQMVAVTYEQARGLREKHQKPEGYEISVSRTIAVSAGALYKAWKNERTRRRWLPDTPIVIRKATEAKCLRITWKDGKTSVDVSFYPKGEAKCQVTVQHGKLPDAKAGARMKTFWAESLDRLKETVEA